jgi:hypothetical protein
MPLLTPYSSYSCLRFAAPEVPHLAPCRCSGIKVSHNFAKARRLLRAREASTLRFGTFRVAEEGSQAPFRMAVSAESVAQSDDVSALSHVR